MTLEDLLKELQNEISLKRIARNGFFRRIGVDDSMSAITREVALHRAVLDKALTDWFSFRPEIRSEVIGWLDLTNPDFLEACDRAMIRPDMVFFCFKQIKKLMELKGNANSDLPI